MSDSTTPPLNVAVIGLGSMGCGVARSSLRAAHRVWRGDINPDAVARFEAESGQARPLTSAGPDLVAIAVLVLNAAKTESLLFGPQGIVEHLRPGSVVSTGATAPPAFARAMAVRCAKALTFGMTLGLSPEKFVGVIRKCAGTGWTLASRAAHVVAGDYAAHSSVNIGPRIWALSSTSPDPRNSALRSPPRPCNNSSPPRTWDTAGKTMPPRPRFTPETPG